MAQNNTKVNGKCFQKTKEVTLYTTEKQRIEQQVPSSTQIQNAVANSQASRRNKIRLQNDDMLARKNKVRARLQKKTSEKETMNLLISELTEHQKILTAFQELPADLKKYILSFYKSTVPIYTCPYCNWQTVPPSWSIYSPREFCCSWGHLKH